MTNRSRLLVVAAISVSLTQLAQPQTAATTPKLDGTAKDTVSALKKLQSRAEIGVEYQDYSSALADAYFPVKSFLESNEASKVPEFSEALRQSIKWYRTAGDVWKIELTGEGPAEQRAETGGGGLFCNFGHSGPALCAAHPELIESMVAADGHRFSFIINHPRAKSFENAEAALKRADRLFISHQ